MLAASKKGRAPTQHVVEIPQLHDAATRRSDGQRCWLRDRTRRNAPGGSIVHDSGTFVILHTPRGQFNGEAMSDGNDTDHNTIVITLGGALEIGAMPEARLRVAAALHGGRSVTLDCAGATDFDVSFAQMLHAARILATRLGVSFRLAEPIPPRLASLFVEGGFHALAVAPGRSAS